MYGVIHMVIISEWKRIKVNPKGYRMIRPLKEGKKRVMAIDRGITKHLDV